MTRILLLGQNGQVGFELVRTLAPLGELITPPRSQLDLEMKPGELVKEVHRLGPDLIVNAAAYTGVDKAESESSLAWQINAEAPAAMAAACQALDIPLIHFSTDYVFNGKHNRPWLETDTPEPLSVYGASKLAGEQAIYESGAKHAIFRTSWVYGQRGHNFLITMKRLATERDTLKIVDDQTGTPTWSRHIAEAVSAFVAMSTREKASFWTDYTGIYHLTNAGQTTWFGFAKAIFEELSASDLKVPDVRAINTADYPTPARRPAYSVLDNTLLYQRLGIRLPDWRQTLKHVLQDSA
jgi:dTDP-4-dehydrorhamnose reductase